MNLTRTKRVGFVAAPPAITRALAALALAVVVTYAAPRQGHAQSTAIDVQRFHPTYGTYGGFGVEGPRTLEHLQWFLAVAGNYAASPLQLREVSGGGIVRTLVEHRTTLDVAVALGLGDVVELAVDLPVVAYNTGDGPFGGGDMAKGGLGDLRVSGKAQFVKGLFGLSIGVDLLTPTGDDESFMGTGGVRVIPRMAMGLDFETVRLLLNLGMHFQAERELANLTAAHELLWGFGLVIHLENVGLDIVGEAKGFTRLRAPFQRQNESGAELMGGLRVRVPAGIVLAAGAGPGLLAGYGTPEWRVFASVGYEAEPRSRDADGDGIRDGDDACPQEAEDPDRFEDGDGCPDEDNDKDGVLDTDDVCPDKAEDRDGHEDLDGCPDPDNDGDGLSDGEDKCPDAAEDKDGFEDGDGCPDRDNDKDGLPDFADDCPNEPETHNGHKDDDGCPDEKKRLVEVTCERIELHEKVYFEQGRAVILPESYALLDEIADVLISAEFILKVQVEGHTDSDGSARKNRDLSQRRAEAVVEYLGGAGVRTSRLRPVGRGEDMPIDSNRTAEGKAANRRVEFVIIDQLPQPGCEGK